MEVRLIFSPQIYTLLVKHIRTHLVRIRFGVRTVASSAPGEARLFLRGDTPREVYKSDMLKSLQHPGREGGSSRRTRESRMRLRSSSTAHVTFAIAARTRTRFESTHRHDIDAAGQHGLL